MPPTAKAQQKLVDDWNAKHPIGTPVTRFKLINPLRDPQPTYTSTEAWLMGDHSAMVRVEGVSGAVALESVVPRALTGAELITQERLRQIHGEGWTPEHDATHTDGELALAALSYINHVTDPDEEGDEKGKSRPCWDWPWTNEQWKPSDDPIRNLVKAGALLAAEIDRLQAELAKAESHQRSSASSAVH